MNRYLIIIGISAISFAAGKYLFPPKPEVKEVVRYVEIEKKIQSKDKIVKKVKTKRPDGTVIEETVTEEKTKTVTDKSSQLDSTKITKSGSKLTLGVLYIKDVDDFSSPASFGATVTVPLLGNIKAQALGTTDKKIGLGLALDF